MSQVESGRWKAEGGMEKAESGMEKAEGGKRNAESGRWKAESGRWKAESGMEKAEGGKRKAEGGMAKAESGKRKVESGTRKAEGGMEKAESGTRKAEGGMEKAESGKRKVEGGRRNAERQTIGAIDAWATCIPPQEAQHWPDEFRHVFRRYGSIEKLTDGMQIETMVAEMDEAGVDIAVLSAFVYKDVQVTNEMVGAWVKQYPKKFVGCGTVDPRGKPMRVLDEIKRMVNDLGLIALRLEPYAYGDGIRGLPPTERAYWPLYAKCCELNVPVAIQVGHTGPLLPSEAGRPIYLDEVALAFPELKIIGAHLGQPWDEEMMILAWKHPNVYIDTSARPAKRWPPAFVEFARGWGQDKVLWATDYPLLPFKRCLDDVDALDLPFEAKRKLLRDNAKRVFGIA